MEPLEAQPQAQPIPLIKFEGEKFRITEEAIEFIKKLDGPLGVITIVGKYRTGKSLFLNKVLLNRHSFRVCPTINSCTKGLWISRQVIKSEHPEATDMDVLVIDSEGFGAMEETDAYNNRILLFALLLSSYFIYNSVGSIDEKSLNNLNVITNLAKELQARNSGNDRIEEEFPTFMWIVRDFTLRLADSDGCPMEPKQYLQYALEIQKGISDAVENKNKIRRMIKHFFRERDCFTLVTPVESESDLQQLNTLPNSALRPQFLQQTQVLRQKIMRKVRAKKIKSTKLTGETFIELANSYIEAINSGCLPNIDSAWKSISKIELGKTIAKAKAMVESRTIQFISQQRPEESFAVFEEQLLNEVLSYLRKSISNESEIEQSSALLKQFVFQNVTNARLKNKEASLQILLHHFHDRNGDYYEDSHQALETKWKELQATYKTEFADNPCLEQFLLHHFYPLKLEAFSSLVRRQNEKLKWEQSEKQSTKEVYEKKRREVEEARRDRENKIVDLERQLAFLKAKHEEEERIKSIEIGYIQRELNETKDELHRLDQTNRRIGEELKEKEKEIFDLRIQLSGLSFRARELESQKDLALKELNILRTNLANRNKEVEQLRMQNIQARNELDKQEERQKSLQTVAKTELETKSQQMEQLNLKCDQLLKQGERQLQKIAKLESQVELETGRAAKEEKMYQAIIETLKSNYETERQHMLELTEANRNMAFALRHLEQRFEQAEEKERKMKEFKKCFKNSSCMQCQNCSKFFVPSIFPQHLNVCILSPENFSKIENGKGKPGVQPIEIEVKQTLLKDSESKPYTEYLLEVRKNGKAWNVSRKYKQFCSLHSQLKTLLPGINLSDYSYIVNPQEGSRKCLPVEERRKILEKYMKDLCENPHIAQETVWKEFIADTSTEGSIPHFNKERPLEMVTENEDLVEKENSFDSNRLNHKTPQQFLRIWNERNLRTKEVSKNKKIKL